MTVYYDSQGRVIQIVEIGGDFIPGPAHAAGSLWFDHVANPDLATGLTQSSAGYLVKDGTVWKDGEPAVIADSQLSDDRAVAKSFWDGIKTGTNIAPNTDELCATLRVLIALIRMQSA